jgi:hypothetical protein
MQGRTILKVMYILALIPWKTMEAEGLERGIRRACLIRGMSGILLNYYSEGTNPPKVP